jgi:hypothetical protein
MRVYAIVCVVLLTASIFAAPSAMAGTAGGTAGDMNFYFGSLHGHSAASDGTGTPQEYFTWARDTAAFDFCALTDHGESLDAAEWSDAGVQADLFNQDGSFTTLRGFEWSSGTYGHIAAFNTGDYTSASSLPELSSFYQWLDDRGAAAQFNHPGIHGDFNGLAYVDSASGVMLCQETANKLISNAAGYLYPNYISALDQGWRTAPTANQDNHDLTANSHRTVAVAPSLSRASLLDALANRRVYSSDDPDMRVTFRCGEAWMGSQVEVSGGNAAFTVAVEDDEPITRLEVITRGGTVAASAEDDGTWGDGTAAWNPVLQVTEPSYYFLRVYENDVHDDEGDGSGVEVAVTAPIWVTPLAFFSFFAEGYTGDGFQEYLCLANPGGEPIEVRVSFLFPDGQGWERWYTLPASSRSTVDVNAEVGAGREVSMLVESPARFVAERPMYFSYGEGWTGGSDVIGASVTSREWYFAEGYTGEGFDEWICVLNPGDVAANLTFRFQTLEEGEIVVEDRGVPARSRATFKVNDMLGTGYQTSLKLESDTEVVAERAMYFDYRGAGGSSWTGGHCVMGTPALATAYFLAEGTTRSGFEEWLCLQNPGDAAVTVSATYSFGAGQGDPFTTSYLVEAGRRFTIYVPGETMPEKDVSVGLTCDSPFLVERPMYFSYGQGWTGGHCAVGTSGASLEWFFAEGCTGEGFDEWLCLQNPGEEPSELSVIYYPEEGPSITRTHILAPLSRATIYVNQDLGPGLSTSLKIESGKPVIAERPMYFSFRGEWDGGHVVAGLPSP